MCPWEFRVETGRHRKTLTLIDITGLLLIHVGFLGGFFNKPSQKRRSFLDEADQVEPQPDFVTTHQ